ncbi:hypothetical protein OY671_011350, partial [Metschnikowia pulcherrima]
PVVARDRPFAVPSAARSAARNGRASRPGDALRRARGNREEPGSLPHQHGSRQQGRGRRRTRSRPPARSLPRNDLPGRAGGRAAGAGLLLGARLRVPQPYRYLRPSHDRSAGMRPAGGGLPRDGSARHRGSGRPRPRRRPSHAGGRAARQSGPRHRRRPASRPA